MKRFEGQITLGLSSSSVTGSDFSTWDKSTVRVGHIDRTDGQQGGWVMLPGWFEKFCSRFLPFVLCHSCNDLMRTDITCILRPHLIDFWQRIPFKCHTSETMKRPWKVRGEDKLKPLQGSSIFVGSGAPCGQIYDNAEVSQAARLLKVPRSIFKHASSSPGPLRNTLWLVLGLQLKTMMC